MTTPSCPSCLEPIPTPTHFCPKCGAPLSQRSTNDPMMTVRSELELVGRAVRRPSRIALVGMWVLFAPLGLFYLAVMRFVVRDAMRHGSLASIGSALLFGGLGLLPIALVAKTTWRYISTGRHVRRSRRSPARRHPSGDA